MKQLISMVFAFVTAVGLTAGSSSVFAQDTSATVSSTTNSTGGSVTSTQDFQDRKTKILNHISDRLTKMQQIQSCVQAANDLTALQACKPQRDKKHGGGTGS